MVRSRKLLAFPCMVLVALAVVPASASADRDCGVVARPFTDGGAEVVIRKGSLQCTTARGLMRRYWGTRVDAFDRRIELRVAGIRWVCRPTVRDFPYRWECRGGGVGRDRLRVTARD